MSKIDNNPLLKGARGMLGGVIVYRQLRGKVIMANRPKASKTFTEKQTAVREKFKLASLYAKRQMTNPEMKALYETGMNNSKFSAYAVAFSDYLKAPVIHAVNVSGYTGAAGQVIIIKASDDFKVKSVQVKVIDGAGILVEQGEAVLPADAITEWQYLTTVTTASIAGVKIVVTANDTAGNGTITETLKQ